MALKHQALRCESDALHQAAKVRPIRVEESDMAGRIASLIPKGEAQNAFARRCGVGMTTLRKYLAGAEPSASRLVAIADAAGVNIAWLAAGRGPKKGSAAPMAGPAAVELDRMTRAVAAVQEGLQAAGRTVAPERFAQLVMAAYKLLAVPGNTTAQVAEFISATL